MACRRVVVSSVIAVKCQRRVKASRVKGRFVVMWAYWSMLMQGKTQELPCRKELFASSERKNSAQGLKIEMPSRTAPAKGWPRVRGHAVADDRLEVVFELVGRRLGVDPQAHGELIGGRAEGEVGVAAPVDEPVDAGDRRHARVGDRVGALEVERELPPREAGRGVGGREERRGRLAAPELRTAPHLGEAAGVGVVVDVRVEGDGPRGGARAGPRPLVEGPRRDDAGRGGGHAVEHVVVALRAHHGGAAAVVERDDRARGLDLRDADPHLAHRAAGDEVGDPLVARRAEREPVAARPGGRADGRGAPRAPGSRGARSGRR